MMTFKVTYKNLDPITNNLVTEEGIEEANDWEDLVTNVFVNHPPWLTGAPRTVLSIELMTDVCPTCGRVKT